MQESPDFYSVCKVFTYTDLGLDKKLNAPQGIFVLDNEIYLCDTGNNRIIQLHRDSAEKLEVVRILEEFNGANGKESFNKPTDVAVTKDGEFFVADQGSARVLKLDKDLNQILQFNKPVDSTLDPNLVFQPNKLAVDTAGRVYCIATGINKGLIKYENDGTFAGFVGATPVTFDWTDYIW